MDENNKVVIPDLEMSEMEDGLGLYQDNENAGDASSTPAADASPEPKEEKKEDTIGISNPVGEDLEIGEEDDSEEDESLVDGMDATPEDTKFTRDQIRKMKELADNEAEKLEAEEQAAADSIANARNEGINIEAEGVELASRRKNRELYRGNYIHAIGDHLEFESPTERMVRIRAKYAIAARSYHDKQGNVLKGTIMAAEDSAPLVNSKGQRIRIPCCKIFDGPVTVYIPITYLTRLRTDVEGTPEEKRRALRSLANARIGSTVEFMVTHFDEEKQIAIGTRLPVLDLNKRINYLTKSTRTGDYILKEGMIVEARVTYLTSNHIGVEVFGVEDSLRISDVTYSRVRDLHDYFRKKYGTSDVIGKTLPVKITHLTRNPFDVSFSIREGMFDDRMLTIRSLHRGDTVLCEVVNINDSGIFANIIGTEVDVLCSLEQGMRIPNVQNKVSVKVREIDRDNLQVTGYIRKIFE